MTARSSSRRNTRGRGLPGCGSGVSVPTSTKPKPSPGVASKTSAFLSKPAARPTGLSKESPKARVFKRASPTGGETFGRRRKAAIVARCAVSGSRPRKAAAGRSKITRASPRNHGGRRRRAARGAPRARPRAAAVRKDAGRDRRRATPPTSARRRVPPRRPQRAANRLRRRNVARRSLRAALPSRNGRSRRRDRRERRRKSRPASARGRRERFYRRPRRARPPPPSFSRLGGLRCELLAARQPRHHADQRAIGKGDEPFAAIEPLDRVLDRLGLGELGFGERAIGRDLAPLARFARRQPALVQFAQLRIVVDRLQPAGLVLAEALQALVERAGAFGDRRRRR